MKLIDELLKESPFPWWEWDIAKNSVIFNDKKATMLGYDPETFKGKGYQNFTNLLHSEDYTRTMKAMHKVLNGKSELYEIDYRILASNGEYKWYMDRGIVIDRSNNRPIKLRGLVIDLGENDTPELAGEILLEYVKSDKKARMCGDEKYIYTLCSNCKKVETEKNRWIPVSEELISKMDGFPSHGLCPDCINALYPKYAEKINKVLSLVS